MTLMYETISLPVVDMGLIRKEEKTLDNTATTHMKLLLSKEEWFTLKQGQNRLYSGGGAMDPKYNKRNKIKNKSETKPVFAKNSKFATN